MYFKNKKVLVAGGTGLVGIPLTRMLIEQGARVRIASLDDKSRAHPEAEFLKLDLTNQESCFTACRGMDYVFNLLCAKGSPEIIKNYPAKIMRPNTLFNMHLIDTAWQLGVGGFFYTSSIGVYYPSPVMYEDSTEKMPPPPIDYAGRSKLYSEWYAMALARENNWNVAIARPANIYGPYDNFDSLNSSVIPALIKKALTENPWIAWGDGTPIRDFIHTEDVARGMLLIAEKNPGKPVNLGSGDGTSIWKLVETIALNIEPRPKVMWDTSKDNGDAQRILDISQAQKLGFEPQISLWQGIRETIEWYKANKDITGKRYDLFNT